MPRLAAAASRRPTRCDLFRAAKEYSYRAKQAAGDGWVLVGDAFGFLDPLYSSGVLLALKSGAMAADAISEGLAKRRHLGGAARQVGAGFHPRHGPHAPAGVRVLRRLQLRPLRRRFPASEGHVTDVLIGDVFKDDVDMLWEPMDQLRPEARWRQRCSVVRPWARSAKPQAGVLG